MSVSLTSQMCDHAKTTRLDKNFIRCTKCGQSIISKTETYANKGMKDFVSENKSFQRNFDRNFSNVITEVENYATPPVEYYVDANRLNYAIVDRTVLYASNPPKYKIMVNGDTATMTNDRISEFLQQIRAIRIPKEQFDRFFVQ